MAGLAVARDTCMIKNSVSKTYCIVAPTTIFGSGLMSNSIGGRCGIYAGTSVVAGLTRLA